MRNIVYTNEFKRNLKRASVGKYRSIIKGKLWDVINAIANDELLDYSYHDHALIGNLKGCRECHLSFDFVLVYRLGEDNLLVLERLGTHSEVLGL